MKQQKIRSIFNKFLDNTATVQEIEELCRWAEENPSEFKESAKFHYLLTKALGNQNTAPLKSELLEKFDFVYKREKRKKWAQVYKYAAVFVGVALIGTYLLFNNQEQKAIISSGSVTLISENGSEQEALREEDSKTLSQAASYTAVQQGTKITYKKLNSDNSQGELVYNTLNVPYGKKFQLELSDGTEIYINSGSTITYPVVFHDNKPRNVVLEGEAYFSVNKNSKSPFTVSTKSLDTKVYGTEFNVSSYSEDNRSKVVLVEGSVEVSQGGRSANRVMLEPNQMASYSKQEDMFNIEDVDISSHIAWKDGVLLFKSEDFGQIITKLERHYNIDIEIQDNLLKKEKYTGRFKTETIEEVLEGFQRLKGFDYKIEKDRKIILTKTK